MKHTNIDANQLELNDKVVAIKRVSKTVKGGRTMRFSALVVVGDGNGHVGAGLGKAGEVPEAIRKGKEAAVKNMVSVPIDENNSIPHDLVGNFGSASVLLKRANEGTSMMFLYPNFLIIASTISDWYVSLNLANFYSSSPN